MSRKHKHRRRSRKFLSVNEYSLYRNRIYLLNAIRAAQQNRAVRKELLDWFSRSRNEGELEITAPFLLQEYHKAISGQTAEDLTQQKVTRFLNTSVKILEEKTREAPPPSPTQTAIHLVIQRFSLGPMAGALLQLAYYYNIYHSTTHSLWDQLQNAVIGHIETTTILLSCSPEEVEDAFRELADVGITDFEDLDGTHTDPGNYINIYFDQVWCPPVRDMDELMARLVGRPCEATLHLKDYSHLDNRDNAMRLLSAAMQKRREGKPVSGVNILLYGRAGTGKTEFAKTLSRAAGAYLYSIGELRLCLS